VLPRLRDPDAAFPTVGEFIWGGDRRVPRGPLPAMDPLGAWRKKPGT
jgi:hypothetical protein